MYIIRVDTYGFPHYACGTSGIVLIGSNRCCIARLNAAVPGRLSPNRRLPAWQYWPRLFFTNQLEAKVTVHSSSQDVLATIKKMYRSSLYFSCKYWEINDEVGETIWKTIQGQAAVGQKIGRFCFCGSRIGSWVGGGSNCTDWMNDILRKARATGPGRPISFGDLLDKVEPQAGRCMLVAP